MQQLQSSFSKFKAWILSMINMPIQLVAHADLEVFKYFEMYLINLAEMLMKCNSFASLPFNDKVLLVE